MTQHYHMGSMCPACLEESGQMESAFPKLNPGIYNVRMRTREGSEYTVEVKADSEADACATAAFDTKDAAEHADFLHTAEVENG